MSTVREIIRYNIGLTHLPSTYFQTIGNVTSQELFLYLRQIIIINAKASSSIMMDSKFRYNWLFVYLKCRFSSSDIWSVSWYLRTPECVISISEDKVEIYEKIDVRTLNGQSRQVFVLANTKRVWNMHSQLTSLVESTVRLSMVCLNKFWLSERTY